MLAGCSNNTTSPAASNPAETSSGSSGPSGSSGKKFKVGFSQATMNHPFRVAMVEENVNYAKEHYPEMEIIVTDGNNDSAKQVSDVEDLIAQGIDALIISPLTAEALTDVCAKAMEKGIPVITLDRNVNTEVTTYIGAENKPMGVASAKLLAEMTNKKARIIEIQGTAGASATIDRHDGFVEELANYPEMKIIAEQYCDYLRENAMKFMEDMLQRFGPGEIDAVYAHNDEMALGALEAIRAAGRENEGIILIGMDGTEVAFEAIKNGSMAFTVVYPYCAPEGVQYTYKILNGEKVDKRIVLDTAIVSAENIDEWLGKGL
ncbi:MAG: substrate-binding domain-containing protein [Clostridiaceae bacterium]|nr:substrate-binding domain-containing protein [Clostridiaceae bacterium]